MHRADRLGPVLSGREPDGQVAAHRRLNAASPYRLARIAVEQMDAFMNELSRGIADSARRRGMGMAMVY
jgi:hypothetical protein